MFNRQDLIAALSRSAPADTPPLEALQFDGQDFKAPDSEESIWLFRGWKHDYASGLHFWLRALHAQGWSGREGCFRSYAESGLCEPIGAEDFSRMVKEYGGGFRQPLPFHLGDLSGYRSGLRMVADWNDAAAVAELADAYVAFHWWTTA